MKFDKGYHPASKRAHLLILKSASSSAQRARHRRTRHSQCFLIFCEIPLFETRYVEVPFAYFLQSSFTNEPVTGRASPAFFFPTIGWGLDCMGFMDCMVWACNEFSLLQKWHAHIMPFLQIFGSIVVSFSHLHFVVLCFYVFVFFHLFLVKHGTKGHKDDWGLGLVCDDS